MCERRDAATATGAKTAAMDAEGGPGGKVAAAEMLGAETTGQAAAFLSCPKPPQLYLERKVELALLYFAYCRTHRGLGGATPAEVFYGIRPAHLDAASPHRGRPGYVGDDAPFEIVHLDPEIQIPLLVPKAA